MTDGRITRGQARGNAEPRISIPRREGHSSDSIDSLEFEPLVGETLYSRSGLYVSVEHNSENNNSSTLESSQSTPTVNMTDEARAFAKPFL